MAGAPEGNTNAAKGRLWHEAIRRAIARKAAGNLNNGLDNLADKLVSAADSGEQWAILEIGNRLDGKPAQAVMLGSDAENPVTFNHTVEFIGSSAAASET